MVATRVVHGEGQTMLWERTHVQLCTMRSHFET